MTASFGKEISCTTSLRTGRYVTGARLVGEALYRRLTTPRGTLRGGEDEADYGIDITDVIGSVSPRAAAASLPGRIQAELVKDPRVESVSAKVLMTTEGSEITFAIAIAAVTTDGPVDLNIAVSGVTVELLGITTGE